MSIGENKLVIGIILGALLGIFCGWSFGESMLSLSWLGDLFLDALKMMIVPLIVGAIISGVTSLGDVRRLGKVGGYTLLYYAMTTACAVLIGLILGPLLITSTSTSKIDFIVTDSVILISIAGFLVGLGTRIGGGCTSGHGICGISLFSIRSIIATLVFILAAILTVFVLKLIGLIFDSSCKNTRIDF